MVDSKTSMHCELLLVTKEFVLIKYDMFRASFGVDMYLRDFKTFVSLKSTKEVLLSLANKYVVNMYMMTKPFVLNCYSLD